MRTGRPRKAVSLTDQMRTQLESFASSRSLAHGLVTRAKIVLLAADGVSDCAIAKRLGTTRVTVAKWRTRCSTQGLEGLYDELRPGRPRTIADERIAALVRRTLRSAPKGATQWTLRSMAKDSGVSSATVHRVWRAFGLQPHRQRSFKLSNDPFFVEKVRDIVGLYLDPPDNALVLCVDEKSQMQALERSQPMLPLGLGYVQGVTHDYIRHGTTTLFAALDIATGRVLHQCRPRHRHQDFLAFLRQIDQNTPPRLDVHIIADNYATHKHPKVKRWLLHHPRFHMHHTPTYSSWLNQVEIWFNIITQRAIRRGSFSSVKNLIRKVNAFVENHNKTAAPFVWTATADSILSKLHRLCQRISESGH